MKRHAGRYLVFTLLIVALFGIVDGLYIQVKAVAAQYLLKKAWQETVAQQKPVKPWPWADTWPVARLRVERLGIDCIVLAGDSGEVLAFGPGHLSQSAVPATEGNCVLMGHRDTSFSFLKDIVTGDILSLQNVDERERHYEIVSTTVKKSRELFLEETVTPWLTLVTCYPFDTLAMEKDLRFVVFARELKRPGEEISGFS
ncbi:MAG: class GN sortase, partial [Desulfopila sp.]|nr:class GN sortase [Desulfopila sp.]